MFISQHIFLFYHQNPVTPALFLITLRSSLCIFRVQDTE